MKTEKSLSFQTVADIRRLFHTISTSAVHRKRTQKTPDPVVFVEKPNRGMAPEAKGSIYKGVSVEVHFLFSSSHSIPKNRIIPTCLRLVRPDVVGNLPHQLELVHHTLPVNSIALPVRSKATLRADTDLVEGGFEGDIVALGDELGRINNALLRLLLVLHRGELAGDDAENDVLVRGQVLEGLEAAGALRVVLEVVRVYIELLEQLDGDTVVAALGEVAASNEIAAAQVHADVHVRWQADETVVVQLDVLLEHVVSSVHVEGVRLEAVQELFRAEIYTTSVSMIPRTVGAKGSLTGQVGVVVLDITAAGIVQDLQLSLIGLGDVTKILLIVGIHLLGVRFALTVTQVVPVGSSQSDLQVLDLFLGHQAG